MEGLRGDAFIVAQEVGPEQLWHDGQAAEAQERVPTYNPRGEEPRAAPSRLYPCHWLPFGQHTDPFAAHKLLQALLHESTANYI